MSAVVSGPGDFALGPNGEPVGRVESVLAASSGDRLLIVRAFSKASYVIAQEAEVAGVREDDLRLRWVSLTVPAAELQNRGVFRRDLGRLVRDPFPTSFGAPRPDAEAEAELRSILAEDPMTQEAELEPRVRHGVAVLDGWGGTAGGKVAAERLARTTPGVWEAVNRIVSDEELGGALRTRLREVPELAATVADVRTEHGHVTVTVIEDAPVVEDRLEELCRSVPGVRSVSISR